jgi:hypothetical protein
MGLEILGAADEIFQAKRKMSRSREQQGSPPALAKKIKLGCTSKDNNKKEI